MVYTFRIGERLFVILFCLNEAICHDHKKSSRISECFGVSNSAINHGEEEKPKSYPRSSFEEEPEKQLGLLRSFVFVQNIVVEAKPLFLHSVSSLILKLLGKKREGHTNEH